MVDRPETVLSNRETIVTPAVTKRVIDFEATVSTGNTITLGDLSSIAGAALLKRSDGSAVTCTVATNVITVTQADLTDVVVEGIALGS